MQPLDLLNEHVAPRMLRLLRDVLADLPADSQDSGELSAVELLGPDAPADAEGRMARAAERIVVLAGQDAIAVRLKTCDFVHRAASGMLWRFAMRTRPPAQARTKSGQLVRELVEGLEADLRSHSPGSWESTRQDLRMTAFLGFAKYLNRLVRRGRFHYSGLPRLRALLRGFFFMKRAMYVQLLFDELDYVKRERQPLSGESSSDVGTAERAEFVDPKPVQPPYDILGELEVLEVVYAHLWQVGARTAALSRVREWRMFHHALLRDTFTGRPRFAEAFEAPEVFSAAAPPERRTQIQVYCAARVAFVRGLGEGDAALAASLAAIRSAFWRSAERHYSGGNFATWLYAGRVGEHPFELPAGATLQQERGRAQNLKRDLRKDLADALLALRKKPDDFPLIYGSLSRGSSGLQSGESQ